MTAKYNAKELIEYLQKQPDIIPDSYDGSYELCRETIRAYSRIADYRGIDYRDLNTVYLMWG